MRKPKLRAIGAAWAAVVLLLGAQAVGDGDYSADYQFSGKSHPEWPSGMLKLVNSPARVAGFSIVSQDFFFYTGTTAQFQQFLEQYAHLAGVAAHRLNLMSGKGSARSPWGSGPAVPCDWTLSAYPGPAASGSDKTTYIVELGLWTGGKIKLEKVKLPKDLEIVTPDQK